MAHTHTCPHTHTHARTHTHTHANLRLLPSPRKPTHTHISGLANPRWCSPHKHSRTRTHTPRPPPTHRTKGGGATKANSPGVKSAAERRAASERAYVEDRHRFAETYYAPWASQAQKRQVCANPDPTLANNQTLTYPNLNPNHNPNPSHNHNYNHNPNSNQYLGLDTSDQGRDEGRRSGYY